MSIFAQVKYTHRVAQSIGHREETYWDFKENWWPSLHRHRDHCITRERRRKASSQL